MTFTANGGSATTFCACWIHRLSKPVCTSALANSCGSLRNSVGRSTTSTALSSSGMGLRRSTWRLETRRGDGSFIWPALRAGAFAAVGWGALGDLSGVAGLAKTRTAILRLLQQHYPSDPKGYAHDASQIRDFIKRVQPGDVVLAADGGRILGTGRVTGPYQYDLSGLADAPHRRAVDWRSTDEWKLSTPEGVHSTFVPIRDYSDIIQSERRLRR